MSSESSPMRNYLEGLRRALPIMLGYVPVGFAFGVLAVKNNIPPALAVGMSLLMFSGSGQFVLASLWGAGAGILSVIAAVFIVNLRYLLMSAAESPWLAALPRCQRFLLGLGLTDETFVVHITALQQGWKLRLSTLYVCNSATWLSWVAGSAVGAFCGEQVSDVKPLGLDYALTAMFLALLVPQCVSRLHVLVAVFTAALSIGLRGAGMSQWNVAVATILGASLGAALLCRKQPAASEGPDQILPNARSATKENRS
ncbi:AzlC family ABC transporter permease [Desulfovibrio sp. ZJ369]|uniref:AzlC family ABC transporter permease n=1 Tax=Desulfovibrio sp. ZJ369 TaxID=2709793 RepID=UPI0013EA0621|nr:AzlC family ABC transporter permease [Desulfovibrio sp. ZJ369]